MKIDSIQVGPIMTNCYLLCDDAAGVCCVIDPGRRARARGADGAALGLRAAVYSPDARPL